MSKSCKKRWIYSTFGADASDVYVCSLHLAKADSAALVKENHDVYLKISISHRIITTPRKRRKKNQDAKKKLAVRLKIFVGLVSILITFSGQLCKVNHTLAEKVVPVSQG